MKRALLAVLASTMMTAHAAENYGGIRFHSSVPANQVQAMKIDINYLYNTPVTIPDQEFVNATGMLLNNGHHMHNWVVNRVRHIVGESFELNENNMLLNVIYVFPKTPLPDGFGQQSRLNLMADGEGDTGVKTIMSNLGGALYLMGKIGLELEAGKKTPVLLGAKLDDQPVWATSARIGLLKVGEGLFHEKFNIAPDVNAPANSVNRLSTFFHEARHSDGNGKSTGFLHAVCPKTHAYGGHAACEKVSNGPYTIGALTTRNLLMNCAACTTEQKTALAVTALDSFSRVLSGVNSAARLTEYRDALKIYQEVLSTNNTLLTLAKTEEDKAKIRTEIQRVNNIITIINADIAELEKEVAVVPSKGDPNPEGSFAPVSLAASKAAMTPKPAR